jgi:8-oxo-dGTP pyrophosphatase MutT (NUDIX family)
VTAEPEVLAAGGIVWRRGEDGPEIVIVHRPKYDDWSLPKGKLDEGEDFEAAALREVEEETGLRARLGPQLGETSYRDRRDRLKLVRYYEMQPEGDAEFVPTDEVDELRWLTPAQAKSQLTYDFDRELVEKALDRIS